MDLSSAVSIWIPEKGATPSIITKKGRKDSAPRVSPSLLSISTSLQSTPGGGGGHIPRVPQISERFPFEIKFQKNKE